MNVQGITRAFDDAFDQALLFHGFADFMRDYDLYVYATADPRTKIPPDHLRYRFTHCVRATTTTAVRPEVWSRSLSDELTDYAAWSESDHPDGYVWGVKWQMLYPGMQLRPSSPETRQWSAQLGIPMHEALIETNGHDITLVFSDLRVEKITPGTYAYAVLPGGPDGKYPLG